MTESQFNASQAIQRAAGHLVAQASHAGLVVTIETVPQAPLAMGNYSIAVNVREARHAPEQLVDTPAPLDYDGTAACAYVCFAANGNCIIWSTNQQQVANAAAQYGRPYIPLYGPKAGEVASLAASAVLAERARQINAEGWTPEHDDQYSNGELAVAAGCYAPYNTQASMCPAEWPWDSSWWKPTTRRRALEKAGALILAEIERLDRAAVKGGA